MLRLPNIEPSGMERLCKLSAATTTKYDDSQPRDWHGRWTSGNSSSQAAPTGAATSAPHSRLVGRWPDAHRSNPNIVLTQGGAAGPFPVPIFPPLLPGNPLNPQTPKNQDPPIIFPAPDVHSNGVGQGANDSATANTGATTDNQPRACPDSSYEPGSDKRTPEQLLYQAQINGLPLGYHVILNGVGYDGCRESDNTMLEAKHIAPWFVYIPDAEFRTMAAYKEIKDQGFRQNNFSGGRRVEWHFDDPQVAYYWRNEFTHLGYKNISVKYTAYNTFAVKQ